MTDKFKLAIIGCGGHARGTLAPLWADIPEIEPVAACDAHAESLANFAELFGIENTYSDARKMLAEQQPDILIVGSWPASHMENVLDGVNARVRAIFCEKPIALNAGEAERMFEAARSAGVILVEGFMHLYHPQTRAVKKRLDDGAVGELRCIRASFSSGSSNPTNWRRRGELGGGAAMDLGCYCLSSIRYLVGEDPLWVSANGNFDADAEIWHTLLGTLHFENGVIGQFDTSFGWPRRGSCEVVGTGGTIWVPRTAWSWPREGSSTFTWANADYRDPREETVEVAGLSPYRAELLDLVNALSTGEPTLLPDELSVATMRLIDAVHESARTGRRVEIG